MSRADDIRLVRRAREGDSDAFRQLFDRHHKRLYNYMVYAVNETGDAADLTQMTFIKAWENLPRLRNPNAFVTWLHRIAVNVVKDYARKRKDSPMTDIIEDYTTEPLQPPDPATSDPETVVADKQRGNAVRQAVSSLPDKHRDVVVMHHLEGMEITQIAQVLGVAEGTVLSRLARARETLKRKLRRLVDEPPEVG